MPRRWNASRRIARNGDNEAQKTPRNIGCDDLLARQAAGLTRSANARTKDENGFARHDRRHQIGDEFRGIAAVAVEKEEDVCVIAHSGDACLDRATVAASRLDDDTSSGRFCPLGRTVPRAPVDNDDFAHILLQHSGHDLADRRFLVEARNDRGNDGQAALRWPLSIDLVGRLVHRLQRRPQLAQLLGGFSESSAARKSRYAGPFQISPRD